MTAIINDFSLLSMDLLQQANLLEFILDNADFSIIAQNVNGKLLAWNKGAELKFGYRGSEITDTNVLYDIDDLKSGKIQKIFAQVTETGHWQGELTLISKDGMRFTSPVTVVLYCNPKGDPLGFTLISQLLTETQRQFQMKKLSVENRELEDSNYKMQEGTKLKNAFIANMSHDLRTPLNGIIGFSEIMSAGKAGPITLEHKEYLQDILYSARHLLALINDMLDIAKLESGKMEFSPEKIHLQTLVGELKTIFSKIIADKKINLSIEIDPTLTVIIDAHHFKRVLYNLVSNALKFTQNNGNVSVKISSEQKHNFSLRVEDSGIGIAKKDIRRLFVPFQQLDNSSQETYQGTGLGLALSRHIVESQGGTINASSVLGKGSIFTVILPRVIKVIQVVKVAALNPVNFKQPSMLIIEEPSMEKTELLENLSRLGYTVRSANNMNEALGQYKVSKFDAIILDLFISDLSKWKLLRALRTQSPFDKAPTLLIGGAVNNVESYGFKIHDCLLKPVDPTDLINALQWSGADPDTGKSVLIVDNDAQALKRSKTILIDKGYDVISESDLEEALIAVKDQQPDAIILNLYMETNQLDGFDFLHRVRFTEKGRYTPIVITTLTPLTESDQEHIKGIIQRMVLKKEIAQGSLIDEIVKQFPIAKEELETESE